MVSTMSPCSELFLKYPILENDEFTNHYKNIVLVTNVIKSLNEIHNQQIGKSFSRFERLGIGKSIGKYLSLLESAGRKHRQDYTRQEKDAVELYEAMRKDLIEEKQSEEKMIREIITERFCVTPKEYFNIIDSIKAKQLKKLKLRNLEKDMINLHDSDSFRYLMIDVKGHLNHRRN